MKPKVQGIIYNKLNSFFIKELEVSITSKCHLRCNGCGFYVPQQPDPAETGDVVAEIATGLAHLQRLNIKIGSLGILGGEPTYNPKQLEFALTAFTKFDNIDRVELVSHGLTPQNISKAALTLIDRLTISVYFSDDELVALWKSYLATFAPEVELRLRKDAE